MKYYLLTEVSGRLWDLLKPHFKEAEEHHSFINADDLRHLVVCGHARVVIAVDDAGAIHGACALEVVFYPRGRTLNIFMAGTSAKTVSEPFIPAMFQFIREIAQNMGCIGVSFTGRRGWVKWLKDMGLQTRECVYAWERYDGARHDAHDGLSRNDAHTNGSAATH